jgi:hypothetical protein
MLDITNGLTKATSTHAAAFRPNVLVNASIEIPRMNAESRSIQWGVSKGRSNMK